MLNKLNSIWRLLRQLSGDDAYERYLKHYTACHQHNNIPPLTKSAFFKQWQDNKWNSIKRCC